MSAINRRVNANVSSLPGLTANFSITDIAWDCVVGGVPLLMKPSKEHPYLRKTAPYRKEQIDSTVIPGEQSMVFWWLRSQISFHGGAGLLFEEPALEAGILYSDPLSTVAIPVRYFDSEGIDPWTTPGQFSLLPASPQQFTSAAGAVHLMSATDTNSVDMWIQVEGTSAYRCTEGGSKTALTTGTTGTITGWANDGTNYYLADGSVITKGTLTGGAASVAWNAVGTNVILAWAKGRLIAGVDKSLYELVGSGPSLPSPFYTALEPNWQWTAITSGPDGMYAAGFAGNISKIYYIGLTTGVGNVPILAPAVEVAELPKGELLYSLVSCQDSYLVMGTNKGARMASFNGGGNGINYGPLLVKMTGNNIVYDATSYDRFVYISYGNQMSDGTSGLVRIDTGFQTQYQRYAYAKDAMAHVSGAVRSVTTLGRSGRLLFSVDSNGSYLQQKSDGTGNLEAAGFLQTGNIRHHTMDLKLFEYLRIRCKTISGGSITADLLDHNGTDWPVISYPTGTTPDQLTDVLINPSVGKQEYVALKFSLTSNGTTLGPTFLSYQLKSLPAQKNQRMFQIPVMIFDWEKDKNNTRVGYEGFARDRLVALESAEEARAPITYQDLSRKPFISRQVVIDEIEFVQTDPPTIADGQGGIALLTLRTVDVN